jgi:hypothetical protein
MPRLNDDPADPADRLPLELCTGETPECPHYYCPDGYHAGEAPNCSCTPDCALAEILPLAQAWADPGEIPGATGAPADACDLLTDLVQIVARHLAADPPGLFLAHIEADGWPSHAYAFTSSADRDAFTEEADKITPGWYDIEPDYVQPRTVEAAVAALRDALPA